MHLAALDWIIIVAYFAVALAIGLAFSRRAGKNLTEYFVSGRSLPWWIAGTSMVATTFAADTPLAITSIVAKNGLAGNWFWWAFAMGGMFTVFVFARLWRRAEVLTDIELLEMRYGGKPAAFLRGFRALYMALLINGIIAGWVTGAMMKVLKYTVLYKEGVAMAAGCVRGAGDVSGTENHAGSGRWLPDGDTRPGAGWHTRTDGRHIFRRLHVHHEYADQLGRIVSGQ